MLNPLALVTRFVKALLTTLFGQINWSSPGWMRYLAQHKRTGWIIVSVLLMLSALSYYSYQWYQRLPQPELITADIAVPGITPLDKELKPEPLRIRFGIKQNGTLESRSVAPLNQLGKPVKSGIEMSPKVEGEWHWDNDNELVFLPKNDWPAEQEYKIIFDQTLFAPQTKLARFKYKFTTQPLTAAITELNFYQDPQDPKVQQIIATINFNFPVDARSIEDNLHLVHQKLKKDKLDLSAKPYKYALRFDEHKRTAYVQSETIKLADKAYYIALVLEKGIKAATGSAKTKRQETRNILIPDAGNMLRIQKAAAAIIRNAQDRPEQVLTIESTLGLTAAELQKQLHVYLLPQLPDNKEWSSPAQVTNDIKVPANEVNLHAIPVEHEYASLHSFVFNVPPKRQLLVKIDKGLSGYGNYTLSNDYTTIIHAPEYPQEISFLHKGSLLALSGEKKLSVLVRGVPAVKFEVAQVLASDINHLITQTRGDFSNPKFIHQYSFNEKNISKIAAAIKEFNQDSPDKLQYTSLDLTNYLTSGKQPHGLFLLKAEGWDPKENYPLATAAKRLVLVTDMGMIVKDNADGSHDVFMESINQGTPIANVQVQVLGINGEPIQTQTTGADGHAHFTTLKDFKDEHEPVVYVARKDRDLSFIPYNRDDRHLNYSRFDVGGERTDLTEKQLTAFLFTDRGVYRPGDEIHLGMIVKQPYAKLAEAGIPLEAVITDPRGTTVYKQKYNLTAEGYLTLDYKTSEASATGQYNIDLYIIKDGYWAGVLGSTSVSVEEFLPDRLRLRTQLLTSHQTGWLNPDKIKAKVELWNLFGTPAADRRVTGKVILKPKSFHFKQYQQYTFIDPLLDPKKTPKVVTEDLADTKTNNQGAAEFDLGLERFGKSTYELTFFAEGFEAGGGRGVAGQSNALVSPLAYLIGYKADGDLHYIKQNSPRSLHFIAINPELKQIKVELLQAKIAELRQVSTLIKKPDGTYAYQTVTQELPISAQPLTIAEQGTQVNLLSDKIGDYVVSIVDQHNVELSRVKYSIVGASNKPLPKETELAVKLNKTEFNPGETIELQITAPYAGSGLITIERDKVYSYRWFKMDTTSSVQTIQIPPDFIGNGYINIAVMRDWNSAEIFINPLSYNVVPFSVSRDSHNIKLELNTPQTVQPGSLLDISYKTDKPGKIIIYAVDEGILQVTRYETPEPLNYFFRKQALGVITQQTVDQILPKFIASRELSAVGGDALRNALTNYVNPFKRKVDKPVVYWSGIIDADKTERHVSYQVPDYFNGSLKVMAVAAAANAVGSAAKSLTVKGDFVINPNVPTFVAPGDEFTVSAGIANLTGGNQPLTVTLNVADKLEVLDGTSRTLTLSQGQEQPVQFKLRAKAQLGDADLRFQVSAGSKQNNMTSSLSIRPASAYLTTFTAGLTQDKQKTLTIERQLYPEYRKQEVSASASPLILVQGLQRYLQAFPYHCTEQLISKAFALLAFADQPVLHISAAEAQAKFNAILQILRERQLSNGSFSYWPGAGEGYATKFISVYAMHFLTEARQLGYSVPADLFDNGLAYLKDVAAENVSSLDAARIQAYAIYLLTRNEIVTTDYLTNLQLSLEKDFSAVWRSDLTAAYLGATYQLLKNQGEAEQLMAAYKIGGTKKTDSDDFYKPINSDAQYLILLAKHFPERLARLNDQSVLATLVAGVAANNIDTLSAAYSALALKAYEQTVAPAAHNRFTISAVTSNNKPALLATIDQLYQTISFDAAARQILIQQDNNKPYFYLLTQAGYDLKPAAKESKQGIEIYREYRDASGNKVSAVNLGDEIEVHIQIRSLSNRSITNVAILDLLPGGFEVVRDSVKRQLVDYADIREDRVIFFTGVDANAQEITYKIKATNMGTYTVAPILAAAMYDPFVKGQGVAGKISVTRK